MTSAAKSSDVLRDFEIMRPRAMTVTVAIPCNASRRTNLRRPSDAAALHRSAAPASVVSPSKPLMHEVLNEVQIARMGSFGQTCICVGAGGSLSADVGDPHHKQRLRYCPASPHKIKAV